MAASTVQRGSGLRPRKPATKQTLTIPYELSWPALQTGDNRAILHAIRREFPPSLYQRGSNKSKVNSGSEDTKSTEEGNTIKEQRSCLVVGINEVTRALEKGQLSLALVCKTVKPAVLVSHLRLLSATRLTPICAVQGLSDTLAPILKIKKVGACGFKKNCQTSHFEPLVDFIKTKTPDISVPWLKLWRNEEGGSVMNRLEDSQVHCSEGSHDKGVHGTEGCLTECVAEEDTMDVSATDSESRTTKTDKTGCGNTQTDNTGHKNKQRCSKEKLSLKRGRLEDTAVAYQTPNIKTLRIEPKKRNKIQ